MYKVKDSANRFYKLSNGFSVSACGADEDGNICSIDYSDPDGKVVYCLSINDDSDDKVAPYAEVLAELFDLLTR